MPTYTFKCDSCDHQFEKFMTMAKYTDRQVCPNCKKIKPVHRDYSADTLMSATVTLSDDQLKLGHLAKRNGERMSADEKAHLHRKHNEYKYNKKATRDLPNGMTHKKRTPKTET